MTCGPDKGKPSSTSSITPSINQQTSHEQLLAVLDGFDAIVYVADMETYEVLFVNSYSRQLFGEIVGKTCWQVLQKGQNGPCSFCTNNRLLDNLGRPLDTVVWEFQNTVTGRLFDMRDKAIEWIDGRIVRLEIAFDITAQKQGQESLRLSDLHFQSLMESARDYVLYRLQVDLDEPFGAKVILVSPLSRSCASII